MYSLLLVLFSGCALKTDNNTINNYMYCFFSPQQRLKETPTFNSETNNTINNVTV